MPYTRAHASAGAQQSGYNKLWSLPRGRPTPRQSALAPSCPNRQVMLPSRLLVFFACHQMLNFSDQDP